MIKVEGVFKKFKLYHSPGDRLREILFRKSYHTDFTALEDISFELAPGQSLGVIGENGAGKSTLLKILSGIVLPDHGTIQIDGRVTGLLELGTGFNHEMTGLENISMNGTLLGMTRNEIDRKKQTIIDFSELGEFINEPVKTYSSGMVMRLAFSIAIHADPKCFLVDEALSVGDAYFQQKCIQKIQKFRNKGGSIVFVSHDMNAVMLLCDYAVLLDHGKMVSFGIPREIVNLYIARICSKSHRGEKKVSLLDSDDRTSSRANISTNEIEPGPVRILDPEQRPATHVYSDDEIVIIFSFRSLRDIEEPVFGILLRNRYGLSIFGTNTYLMHQKNGPVKADRIYEVSFRFRVSLQPDEYLVTLAIDNKGKATNSFEEYLIRLNDIATLTVLRNENQPLYEGITDLHPEIHIEASPDRTQQGF
jgi:ABC-type polysaccharide/polyol phosphate transport system ATPase subunit